MLFKNHSNCSSVCLFSAAVPTVCLNKWRWECTRVTWSPSRPGPSRNAPKSAPKCSRTSFSHSPSSVSRASFSFLEKRKKQRQSLADTNSFSRPPLNRSFICSSFAESGWVPSVLSVPGSKITGCTDLRQLCATCCYQKLRSALWTSNQPCGDARRKQWSQKGRVAPQG